LSLGYDGSNAQQERTNGKVADVIIENKARTASEILDYYNQSK
jgi:hypothetical protein